MDRRQWLGVGGVWALTQAAGPAQAATRPPRAAATVVEAVQWPAWRNDGARRVPLAPGDALQQGHEVQTGDPGGLVITLPEGSVVRLGRGTRMSLERLQAEAREGQTELRSSLRLFDGFFRFATSAVSRSVGRRDVSLTVRSATVGIRGTDFWSMTDAEHDAACLFQGRIDLDTRDQGALVLDQPTAFWARFFDRPVQPVGQATPAQLAQFLQSTELVPGQGVGVRGGRWRLALPAPRDGAQALGLAGRLRDGGYPVLVRRVGEAQEVRLDGLASREDAMALAERLGRDLGITGAQVRGV